MAAYEIRHMKLGEILDQSFALIKARFVLILGVALIAYMPFELIKVIAVGAARSARVAGLGSSGLLNAVAGVGMLAYVGGYFLVAIPLASAAVIYAASREFTSQQATLGESMRFGLRRIVPLILTSLLKWAIILLGYLLFILPGILCTLMFAISDYVVVVENRKGMNALQRSRELMTQKGAFVTVIIIAALIAIATYSAAFGGLMVAGITQNAYVSLAASSLATSVISVFMLVPLVVFYYSLRSQFENFDLELLAQSIAQDEETSVGALR